MMKGSGYKTLEVACGPHTVAQMMSGKAVTRTLRGHSLVVVQKLITAMLPSKATIFEADVFGIMCLL